MREGGEERNQITGRAPGLQGPVAVRVLKSEGKPQKNPHKKKFLPLLNIKSKTTFPWLEIKAFKK